VTNLPNMRRGFSRREFVKTTTTGAAIAATIPVVQAADGKPAPTIITSKGSRPIIIASANGNFHKNGGNKTCVETAFALMTQGTDVLEALIAGVNVIPRTRASGMAGFRMPRVSCNSMPVACTDRRNEREG